MISNIFKRTGTKLGTAFLLVLLLPACHSQPQWPEITPQNKPWTRWWWMGSAVNKEDLTRRMEGYKEAGLGGLEITPIYGVAGYEDEFIKYLSPRWMEMLEHVLREGQRLNLGIDMATGTGWPFGGPWIGDEHASKRLYYKIYKVEGGEHLDEQIGYVQEPFIRAVGNHIYEIYGFLKAEGEDPEGTSENPLAKPDSEPLTIDDIEQPVSANKNLQSLALEQVRFRQPLSLQALVAYSENGEVIDLSENVDAAGRLNWTAPEGSWTLYAAFPGWHGKMVERAAPGGEGFVIDHFSGEALEHYLAVFDTAFSGHDIGSLRSFFNDSYEVDDAEGQANWTPELFEEFEKRRGYDLRKHLPALLGRADPERHIRVLTDYRETISDLLLEEFTSKWNRWADEKGALTRNQAHGSPANILDLYAASDIPETEGTDILRAKMASSAANVTGKQLISAETATWLNEHFLSSLADVKRATDRFFISGVNHVVYHGTAYSPSGEEWPGWLFYAAVHFNERNPFWDHFEVFNRYAARVQSFLQSGKPDNDVLLYFPIYDQWAQPGRSLLRHFDGGLDQNFEDTAFRQGAELMMEEGYAFDFISDSQLQDVEQSAGTLQTEGGVSYQTVVVPQSHFIPVSTFEKLINLAGQGATIIAYKGLPGDVPGLGDLDSRRNRFEELISRLHFSDTSEEGIREASIGQGQFIIGSELEDLLTYAGVHRESMVDKGLQFTRRGHDTGHIYFITNWSDGAIDGWISLAREASAAAVFDLMQGQAGYAAVRNASKSGSEVYVQLSPGESCIIKTYDSGNYDPSYNYIEPSGEPQAIDGTWTLRFTKGGPELPGSVQTDSLGSWTKLEGEAVKKFSGTGVYSITFRKPEMNAQGWMLDLGEVRESAGIHVNGQEIGTLMGPSYQIYLDGSLLKETNTLEIEITNLMANRIAWLERQDVSWKKFYNVNFPARRGENRNERGLFDASDWMPHPSGLIGPVTLTPVRTLVLRSDGNG